MASVDHTDISAFTQAKRAKPAGFISGAANVDDSCPTSRTARGQQARALRGRLSLLVERGKLGRHGVR